MAASGLALMLLVGLLGPAGPVRAHGVDGPRLPAEPGLELEAAMVLATARADGPWPAPRLPGIFGSGQTPSDRRGGHLEHGTLGVSVRLDEHAGLALGWGWHDRDPVHVETAWLSTVLPMGDASDRWQLGAGRRRVPMGPVIDGAGHLDRHASVPLALRAGVDDAWIDDGLVLQWTRGHEGPLAWLEALDLGLWRSRAYPGGDGAPWAPSLHAAMTVGAWQVDLGAATVAPTGRGAHVQGPNSVHTHRTPDCQGSLAGITCFDGRSDLVTGSLRGPLPLPATTLQAGALVRRDRGLLASVNGEARYRGSTAGGWVDLIWAARHDLTLSARAEAVRSVQTLTGASALPVALDAGLLGSTRITRASTAIGWQPRPDLALWAEVGEQRHGDERTGWGALRLVWTPRPWRALTW